MQLPTYLIICFTAKATVGARAVFLWRKRMTKTGQAKAKYGHHLLHVGMASP